MTYFATPEYICYDLLYGKFQLSGDRDKIKAIETMAQKHIGNEVDLYTAIDIVKHDASEKYGSEWLYKSEEAVVFIVEYTYCKAEREANPIFDKERYEKDMRCGVMY